MGFRINRGIFQFKDTASDTFINKFKIDDRGDMIEVDPDGNKITTYMRLGDKAHDADLLDGVNSGSFLRSDAADSFTSTITMSTQQAFKPANFGQGVYGRYNSSRYQHVWGMGESWHMAENGTNLGNFYGLAYTHTNVGGESKSGLSHQTLFVENGSTKTAIGRGVWTDGNITATGDANISGNLDIGGAVVGSSSGVALAVGGTSTHGVYTGDNARNQLVVSANYYPHFVIAADLSNNSNHGAVISLVGSDSDGTSKSWGIGISNRNPHLFSIGYNKNSDPNPHYGLGDGWNSDDDNHARLSIDRSGNTKIRGSLYVNGTSGGITTGSKVATEAYASGAAETVNARIEEEVLPLIDTKLDAGATAVNADTVDGYHATNAAGGLAVISDNSYWYAPSWINVGNTGIYSSRNNAHFLPNNTSPHGAWEIIGSRGGWSGIYFRDSGNTLMANANDSGFYNASAGWQMEWHNGRLLVSKQANGGGTLATVLDSSNYSSWAQPASTAINTGNIGSQSVASASQVSGVSVSATEMNSLKTTLGVTGLPYSCDIFVEGDPDMYYPVHFIWGDQDVWRRIIIKRGYGETAPWDPIGTGSHRGGLLLDWEGNFGGWGGATYSDRLRTFNESYTTICASMYRTTHSMGYTFFLRGGGAVYHIYSDQEIRGFHQVGTPDIAYDTNFKFYDNANAAYIVYAPAPMDRQDAERISSLRTLKRSELDSVYQPVGSYQPAGSYLTTSGKAADSNLLDGINSTSFLRSDADDTMSGTLTITGSNGISRLRIEGSTPTIDLDDSNGDSFYIHVNSDQFYVLADRNGNGNYGDWETPHPLQLAANTNKAYIFGSEVKSAAFEASSAFDAAGAAEAVRTDLTPLITTATNTADNAASTASTANTAATNAGNAAAVAQTTADEATSLARAAQTTADSKLGATAKAADSNLLDGIDSSAFIRENQDRRYKTIRFTGESGDSGNGNHNYAIYQEGGAWSHPYPDLVIAYHTGVKIGGYWNYGGVRIYNDAPERSGAVKVASFAEGDSNVRITNNLHIGSAGGWITDLLNAKATTGDVAGVDARINDEVLPQVATNATNISRNATDIASKLGVNGKAADSEAVDGVDSSRIVYGANARRSTRYDGLGMVSPNQNSGFYYGNNPDGNPYNEWWNWLTVAGASWTSGNNYDFKIAHDFHSDAMYVSRMANGTQFGWRKVIDSANIGSQTVANAGYATTAGSADQIDGWGFVNTGSNSAVNADSINSNGISYYNGGVPNFSGNATDGALYSQIYSSSWQHQIAGDYRSGQIALRGKNSGTWQAWRTVLDSSNFTSYAEPAGRIDNEILPQVTTNATNIARNETAINGKAAAAGSYNQDFAANDMRVDQWFRNTVSGNGLYNEATTQHFYSDDDDYWNVAGGGSANGIRFRDNHAGAIRGYVYATSSNQVGILDADGHWAVRVVHDSYVELRDNNEVTFRVGQGGVDGNYGTVQTHGNGKGGWAGYSIQGQYVFMSDGSTCGIFNDIDNEWMAIFRRNAEVELMYNGAMKLETTSTGVSVSGNVNASAFIGSLDWANVTNKPTIPVATAPIQALVEGGNESTLASITFSAGEGAATFTLADGQTFRLAFAR